MCMCMLGISTLYGTAPVESQLAVAEDLLAHAHTRARWGLGRGSWARVLGKGLG